MWILVLASTLAYICHLAVFHSLCQMVKIYLGFALGLSIFVARQQRALGGFAPNYTRLDSSLSYQGLDLARLRESHRLDFPQAIFFDTQAR